MTDQHQTSQTLTALAPRAHSDTRDRSRSWPGSSLVVAAAMTVIVACALLLHVAARSIDGLPPRVGSGSLDAGDGARAAVHAELRGAQLATLGLLACLVVAVVAQQSQRRARARKPTSGSAQEFPIKTQAPESHVASPRVSLTSDDVPTARFPVDPLVQRLRRRLRLVTSAAADESANDLASRLVDAVREETEALCVRLHVAQDPRATSFDMLAEVGTSERLASPGSLRSTLDATAARASGLDGVALLPVRGEDDAAFVIELVGSRALEQDELREVDSLARLLAPALFRRRAKEEARRMSRMQRATVAAARDTELDTMFEALADGIAVTNDAGALVRLNAAGREILGTTGLSEHKLDPSASCAHNPLLDALREGTKASGLEVAMATANGARRIVQVKLSPLSREPDSRANVAVFRDVTRERQLEYALRAQSVQLERQVQEVEAKHLELERATRLKSEFLANMSHELRTPLNSVIGFTEVLLDGTYGSLNDRQRDCAGDVLAGGRHLLGLINDVLDLSKIEAGKMELQREDLDLADVLNQALTLVRPQIAAKGIVLKLDVPADVFWAHGDADRIRQVLVNLLSNAVKFTSNGGSVRVEAKRDGAGITRMTVIDSGIGIPAEHANRLFKDFSQVDGSITRRFGGTGLGLAISKRLVELHGGTIGFTSEVSVGSQFFFTVPVAQRVARPAFTMPPPPSRASQLPIARPPQLRDRVLVLDADAAAGRLAAGLLTESGVIPEIASTLAEARALSAARSFDGLLIDPDLGDATQAEALQFATDNFGEGVVVNSTRAHDELELPLQTIFIAKPIDRLALVEQVHAVIARRRGVRRAVVVDPNEVDGAAVQGLLEREGFRVDRVGSLADARLAILRKRPTVVILELDLPDGDGAELLVDLRAQSIATLVLTGRELDAPSRRALEGRAELVARKGTLSRLAFAKHVADAIASVSAPRARVLAVDDNEQNLRLISAVLAQRGCEVLEARDAASALALARAELPDAIFMDVMLPDIDGLSATRDLKADPRTRAIPVIAVTANAMAGDAEKAKLAGCCAYVTKPIESAKLLRALDEALATRSS